MFDEYLAEMNRQKKEAEAAMLCDELTYENVPRPSTPVASKNRPLSPVQRKGSKKTVAYLDKMLELDSRISESSQSQSHDPLPLQNYLLLKKLE